MLKYFRQIFHILYTLMAFDLLFNEKNMAERKSTAKIAYGKGEAEDVSLKNI